jgi:RNA polymerase sigma-70 factor, ECF subfamily
VAYTAGLAGRFSLRLRCPQTACFAISWAKNHVTNPPLGERKAGKAALPGKHAVDGSLTDDKQNEFTALWSEAYPTVAAYTASLVTDHHQTEEVLSRVAITIVRKFKEYDPARSFKAWAIGIARFEVLKFRRERVRDRHLFGQDLLEAIGDRFVTVSDEHAFDGALVKECLEQIHGRPAKAMAMCYGENLRSAEIGRRLGMTASAVRTMLHRARDVIRRCVELRKKEARGR